MVNVVIMLTGMILVLMGVVYWLFYKISRLQDNFNGLVKDCETIVIHIAKLEHGFIEIANAVVDAENEKIKNQMIYHGPVGEA